MTLIDDVSMFLVPSFWKYNRNIDVERCVKLTWVTKLLLVFLDLL